MYCIDTEALVFMFNGGSSYGFAFYLINKIAHASWFSGTPGLSMQYILNENWYSIHISTCTHAGIPYAVAHCQACFDLQGNGFTLDLMFTKIKQISVALHIKTSLKMGNGIGYPTQCVLLIRIKSDRVIAKLMTTSLHHDMSLFPKTVKKCNLPA